MPRRIRKQVHELSVADLEAHPCWVYVSDEEGRAGQDECTVGPLKLQDLLDETGPTIVQAAFMFPNGRLRSGLITLNAGDTLSGHQPVVFLEDGPVFFYNGAMEPTSAVLKSFLRPLRKVCSEPFPISYVTTLHTKGGAPLVSGQLHGLYWLANWRTGRLRAAA
jgi:hypothetical protein